MFHKCPLVYKPHPCIFTPCTCARGKVISSLCLLSVTKIAQFGDSGISVISKCYQTIRSSKKKKTIISLLLYV